MEVVRRQGAPSINCSIFFKLLLFVDLVNQVFFTNACVNIYVTNFLQLLQILPHFLFANDANIVFALLLFANPLMTRS